MANNWKDIVGTVFDYFRIGLTGVRLKNVSGNLAVRNPDDTADASITASGVNVSGDSIVINSDAADTGSDRSITITRPSSGMSAAYTLILPVDDGTPSQVLQTDGGGVLSWVTAGGSTADRIGVDSTSFTSGSTATVNMFTLPANAIVIALTIIIDTPFDGSPSVSIGITGSVSKYFPATQVDLLQSAKTAFENSPNELPVGTTEDLILTYTAGGATVGAARAVVMYVVPS